MTRVRCARSWRICRATAETAYRWADAYAAPVVGRSLLWLQDPHLAKARILLARGTDADVQSALDILDVLHEFAATHLQRPRPDRGPGPACPGARDARESRCCRRRVAAGGGTRAARRLHPGFRRSGATHADHAAPPCRARLPMAAETVRRILAAFPEPQEKIATGDAGSRSSRCQRQARRTPHRPRAGGLGAVARASEQQRDCPAVGAFHSDRETLHSQPLSESSASTNAGTP